MLAQVLDGRGWVATGDVNGDGRLDAVLCEEDVNHPRGKEIAWFDLTSFKPSGTLSSAILDGGSTPEWGVMAWRSSLPPGSSLQIDVRAADDPGDLGEFVQVPASGHDIGELVPANSRYLQYRLSLATADPSTSPAFSGLSLESGPGTSGLE